MDNSEESSMLSASCDEPSPVSARGYRVDSKSCSERGVKRRRWSPYSKRRKLLPKKAFSLETLTLHSMIERPRNFEVTQSTEDNISIASETSKDSDDCCTVAETPDLSTIDSEFAINYNATTCRPTAEWLYRTIESDIYLEPENLCQTNTETSQLARLQSDQETSTDVETDCSAVMKPGQPLAEWLLWCAYAKLMKLTWRNTRKNVNEQTHRAQNCELQAKSTMTQVYSMKAQLKADIGEMRDRVKKIQFIRAILDSNEEDKNRLQSENQTLTSKIKCLNEERAKLSHDISTADQTIEEYLAKTESLKEQLKTCDEELAELKAEKVVIDSEIQELISVCEQAKENATTGRKNVYNRELEIADIRRELAASKDKIIVGARMIETVREQTQMVNKEIEIATKAERELQAQLDETREKCMNRDALIADLTAKVASAVEQISTIKNGVETAEKKSFWRRFRILPKDSRSLFSIQL